MDVSRKSVGGVRSSVVAGSVWETRMKSDEVKGGIKVFNGGDEESGNVNSGEENEKTPIDAGKKQRQPPPKRGLTIGGVAVSGKRKTWKSESFDGFDKKNSAIHIASRELSLSVDGIKKSPIPKARSEVRNREDQLKELTVSVDGSKRSPIQKGRSEVKNGEEQCKELTVSVNGIKKSPVPARKGRPGSSDGSEKSPVPVKKERSDTVERNERSPVQIRKQRSEGSNTSVELREEIVELRKTKSDSGEIASSQPGTAVGAAEKSESGTNKILNGPKNDNDKTCPVELDGKGSVENCEEFGVICKEMVISSNAGETKSPGKVLIRDNQTDDEEFDDGDEEFEEEEEEEEIEIEIEKKSIDVKEVNVAEQKPSSNKIINEVKKFNQFHNRASPFSSTVNKQPPPVINRASAFYSTPSKSKVPVSEEYQSFPQTQNKLQNLVDLVMWRDVSKSAFIFGLGTFIIISTSYTKDLNISFISVVSYLGLVYLAAIFLYRSIICRGVIGMDDSSYIVGEDEAVWLLKLVLPYLNEFLIKLKALFSGDPATTMKLAVMLFVLARCGSSLTIWKMARLGFFGVFIVPKVCSSYSTQLTAYGKFWVRRFRDAWDSCSHKKAVGFAIFTLVWNLSSVVARIWAVFMLFVTLRYYQQSMLRDDDDDDYDDDDDLVDDDGGKTETSWQGQIRGQRQQGYAQGPTKFDANKVKKGS